MQLSIGFKLFVVSWESSLSSIRIDLICSEKRNANLCTQIVVEHYLFQICHSGITFAKLVLSELFLPN